MKLRVLGLFILLAIIISNLAGCSAGMFFLQGKGDQKAQFVFPKEKRVLVFVDLRQGVTAPPDFASSLGTKISDHLFKYKAANRLVAQERLMALERDPMEFSKMGVADVARAVDADVVLYVDVVTLKIAATTDNSLSQAATQVLVKVIDANGVRMWPATESTGSLVSADVDPTDTDSRTQDAMMKELADKLTVRIGRMFHDYKREDADLNK